MLVASRLILDGKTDGEQSRGLRSSRKDHRTATYRATDPLAPVLHLDIWFMAPRSMLFAPR
jgi:hypothetical protein